MDMRESFEAAYEDQTGIAQAVIRSQRMGNGSYLLPSIATAWRWYQLAWKASRDAVVVELPMQDVDEGFIHINSVRDAIRDSGLKVAP